MKTLFTGILAILFFAACSDESGEVARGIYSAELQSQFWGDNQGAFYELYHFQNNNALIFHELRYFEDQDTVIALNAGQVFYEVLETDRIQIGQEIWTFEISGDSIYFFNDFADWKLGAIDPDLYNRIISLYHNG